MNETPLWTILIATLASRTDKFQRLMDNLLPQIDAFTGVPESRVEVIACHNNGERHIGSIRQALLMAATGEYVSFCDDDDNVPPYFVEVMLPALWEKPDVVGFITEYSEGGQWGATVYNSLQHEPHDTPGRLYRDVTHIQPVRTELAQQGDFRGWPEDSTWRGKVRPLLKNEVYIDRCMYFYRHDWSDTVQGNLRPHTFTPRPKITSPSFRWLDLP